MKSSHLRHAGSAEAPADTVMELGFHVVLATVLSGVLLAAVLALVCFFCCRLAGPLHHGGPGSF